MMMVFIDTLSVHHCLHTLLLFLYLLLSHSCAIHVLTSVDQESTSLVLHYPYPLLHPPGSKTLDPHGRGHHKVLERGRGHEGLLGAGAVPPDVVDRSRAGMGCHGMQAYFVQLVHFSANLVRLKIVLRYRYLSRQAYTAGSQIMFVMAI